MNTYGVVVSGTHTDASRTERGAKQYATRNGIDTVSVRYNCGYVAEEIAKRINGKWKPIDNTKNETA